MGTALNIRELWERVDHEPEILRDLMVSFLEEFPRQMQQIREAVARKDLETIATAGHTLKGMLSNVAAEKAAGDVDSLERLARQKAQNGLEKALVQIEHDAAVLVTQGQALLVETKR
jgi:two-component system, sensor histidine kinase and response regulator